MDHYHFEDFVEKPFVFTGKVLENGLCMENALFCLLYIYLNGWNSQAVVNKITATGIWRGSVALILVTYFFTLPTVVLCLYLGKLLKYGALSLHNACPLLFGVGLVSYLAAFPLGAMMVYYPLSENLFMVWLVKYRCQLPSCETMRQELNINASLPCIEEKDKYVCCSFHGVDQAPGDEEKCVQPQFPFHMLNEYLGLKCNQIESIFALDCEYWLIFFVLCMSVIVIDIKGFHNVMKFSEEFWVFNVYLICGYCLLHFEVLVTGAWYYYRDFQVREELLTTILGLVKLEVDNLSAGLPFLLMIGRLLDDSVNVDNLAVKLAMLKIKQQFWQANMYIAVITLVSKRYNVPYICLHDIRSPLLISLGVVPEFFNTTISRLVKYPAMISYFVSIFLKKLATMVLFGNILSAHLYNYKKMKTDDPELKAQVKKMNMIKKMQMSLVKFLVYAVLSVCQRLCNLNSPMVHVMKMTMSVTLALQQMLFSIFVLAIYSVNRLKTDVEAITRRRLKPEMLTLLKFQPLISVLFTVWRLFQFYMKENYSHTLIEVIDAPQNQTYYQLLPAVYVALVVVLDLIYIVTSFTSKWHIRVFKVSKNWGPVDSKRWKNIRPFKPGRTLIFYDDFYISDHMCFINHANIIRQSQSEIHKANLFSHKWPCVFETRKYKYHKQEIDELITEAYSWGILLSYQQQ